MNEEDNLSPLIELKKLENNPEIEILPVNFASLQGMNEKLNDDNISYSGVE